MNPLTRLYSGASTPELCSILGDAFITQISEISDTPINSSNLARILSTTRGVQPLRDANFRRSVSEALAREFGLPRELNFVWGDNKASNDYLIHYGISKEFLGEKESIERNHQEILQSPFNLFPYQLRARQQALDALQPNSARALLHLPTGSGKTRTTLEIVADQFRSGRSKTIIWLAHTDELCEQAAQAFTDTWELRGDREVELVRMWGRQNPDGGSSGYRFVVSSFQTAHSWVTSPHDSSFATMANLRRNCGLLVVDEAHLSLAPTYKAAIEFLLSSSTRLLGLTATPGRGTGANIEHETQKLAAFFENNIIEITSGLEGNSINAIEHLQSLGILSQIETKRLVTDTELQLSFNEKQALTNLLEVPPSLLERIGKDASRNALILAQVKNLTLNHNKRILLFAPSRWSAELLAGLAQVSGISASFIDGSTPVAIRRNRIQEFKDGGIKLLTNYGVLTTGYDDPKLDCVIIARPTMSIMLYSQMIGRAIRGKKVGGTDTSLLVDVDDNLDTLPNYQSAFSHFNTHW